MIKKEEVVKQYCRYCINLYVGLSSSRGWCEAHQKWYERSTCFSANKCKDFEMVECPEEYQDAFYENPKGYRPTSSRKKKINDGEQESMF